MVRRFGAAVGSLAGSGAIATGGNTLTTGGNNTSTDYSGLLSGGGNLTKAGTGNQTLSGASNYTGIVRVNSGTLTIGNAAALAGGQINANGGTADLGGNTVAQQAVIAQSGGIITNGTLNLSSANQTAVQMQGGTISANINAANGGATIVEQIGP